MLRRARGLVGGSKVGGRHRGCLVAVRGCWQDSGWGWSMSGGLKRSMCSGWSGGRCSPRRRGGCSGWRGGGCSGCRGAGAVGGGGPGAVCGIGGAEALDRGLPEVGSDGVSVEVALVEAAAIEGLWASLFADICNNYKSLVSLLKVGKSDVVFAAQTFVDVRRWKRNWHSNVKMPQ